MMRDALAHLESRELVEHLRDQRFKQQLARLTEEQRRWWFGDVNVTTFEDLQHVPALTTQRILESQDRDPPYGVFDLGEYLVTSSGSTDRVKKIPYNLMEWLKTLSCSARGMLTLGMDQTDVMLTTNMGTMQAGYRVMEEAAQLVIGAQVITDRSSSMLRKLEKIRDHGVTVFMASPSKLHRMAEIGPRQYLQRPLKALISTGRQVWDKQRLLDAFGVDDIYDIYGSSEIGQITWTCRHGHRHFNEDFTHVTNQRLFTNLWTLPIFNDDLGDEVTYSYKGRCACGSYLATVDHFQAKGLSAPK